jgi:hypothetical protein
VAEKERPREVAEKERPRRGVAEKKRLPRQAAVPMTVLVRFAVARSVGAPRQHELSGCFRIEAIQPAESMSEAPDSGAGQPAWTSRVAASPSMSVKVADSVAQPTFAREEEPVAAIPDTRFQ